MAAGKLLIILVVATPNLLFNDPNKDLAASFLEPLNFISLFLFAVPLVVVLEVCPFKSSNVKKLENGFVLKFFVSLCITSLSNAKFVLVN